MALGKTFRAKTKRGCLSNLNVHSVEKEFGVVSHKGAMGRKRVEPSPLSPLKTPLKKCHSFGFYSEKSLLEVLPQEILVKILCGVDHEDLDQLFHVSKSIREATLIAKSLDFAFRTPSKTANSNKPLTDMDELGKFDEVEAPNAPKQQRFYRSRMDGKKLADITVALFQSPAEQWPKRGLFMEAEI